MFSIPLLTPSEPFVTTQYAENYWKSMSLIQAAKNNNTYLCNTFQGDCIVTNCKWIQIRLALLTLIFIEYNIHFPPNDAGLWVLNYSLFLFADRKVMLGYGGKKKKTKPKKGEQVEIASVFSHCLFSFQPTTYLSNKTELKVIFLSIFSPISTHNIYFHVRKHKHYIWWCNKMSVKASKYQTHAWRLQRIRNQSYM